MITTSEQPLRKDLIFTWMKNLEVDTGIQFLEDMVHRFEVHSMETILEMKNDFKNRDKEGIAFKAHKLKSAAGNLVGHFNTFSSKSLTAENATQNGDFYGAPCID